MSNERSDERCAGPESGVADVLRRDDVWNGLAKYHRMRLVGRLLRVMRGAESIAEDGEGDAETAHLLERVMRQTDKPYVHPRLRAVVHDHRQLWIAPGGDGTLKVREGYWRRSEDPQEPSPGEDDIRQLQQLYTELNESLDEQSIPGIVGDYLRAVRQRVLAWIIPYPKTAAPALRAA